MSGRKGKNKNQGSSQSENDSDNKGLSNQHASEQINVNDTERQLSMIGGTVLVVCGLLRGSLSGLALAAIGGGLIYRGQTGHCHLYEALEFSSVEDEQPKISGRQDHGREGHQEPRKIHAPS
jgi:uncharacterized membrane protein